MSLDVWVRSAKIDVLLTMTTIRIRKDHRDRDRLMTTYYTFLGVDPDASLDTIREARREILKRVHPDFSHDEEDAVRRARITNAVLLISETLFNTDRRARYDVSIGHARFVRLRRSRLQAINTAAELARSKSKTPNGKRESAPNARHLRYPAIIKGIADGLFLTRIGQWLLVILAMVPAAYIAGGYSPILVIPAIVLATFIVARLLSPGGAPTPMTDLSIIGVVVLARLRREGPVSAPGVARDP